MATPGVVQEVVSVAAEHAERVDTDCAFPAEAVDALRKTGLLGLVLPREIGGMGSGPVEFTEVVAQLSAACGSTAMIYLMHMAAAVTVAASPPPGLPDLLADMASGKQLGTLAFSEPGSRSHFWAPVSTASADGDGIAVRADKSWVTSAGFADVYVVSVGSADGAAGDVDLYAVPADTPGLRVAGTFTGMGLRGNASAPMAVDIRIPDSYRLGEAGGGFGIMMQTVLPWFNLGNAAVSLGLATAATGAAVKHVGTARLEHLGGSLAELPTIRAQIARMGTTLAAQKAYLEVAANSVSSPDDTTLTHVLGVKASVNDAALTITESAMRVCGGPRSPSICPSNAPSATPGRGR
ncbi:acyl-CoA dehydrogenase FadE16 [Mycobacterium tuberculosis]|nr:acyl-CoA dehydrogenase FadE16 [Mycobacterium tuberculosis]